MSFLNAEEPNVVDLITDFGLDLLWHPSLGLELGMRFRSDMSGTITGVRFYKAATNTGSHVVNLWTTGGQLLATTTAGNETASGWQYATFPTPVAITSGTTYVASYFAPNGHYSYTSNAFASSVDNAPLHAVANSTSANGVFAYGNASSFTNQSYNATNYWVDVLYATP